MFGLPPLRSMRPYIIEAPIRPKYVYTIYIYIDTVGFDSKARIHSSSVPWRLCVIHLLGVHRHATTDKPAPGNSFKKNRKIQSLSRVWGPASFRFGLFSF